MCNYTPLHKAAKKGHFSVVEYLVNHKAGINAQTKNGKTPLRLSSKKGNNDITKFLKENGAKEDCRI